MAKAAMKPVPVQKTVTVIQQCLVLELTEDEAQFLKDLMGRIGGSLSGRRRHAESISEALCATGALRDVPFDEKGMNGVVTCE